MVSAAPSEYCRLSMDCKAPLPTLIWNNCDARSARPNAPKIGAGPDARPGARRLGNHGVAQG